MPSAQAARPRAVAVFMEVFLCYVSFLNFFGSLFLLFHIYVFALLFYVYFFLYNNVVIIPIAMIIDINIFSFIFNSFSTMEVIC